MLAHLVSIVFPREPATHDYTVGAWGRDVVVLRVRQGGHWLRLTGWGHGVVAGDFLLLRHPFSYRGATRYRVVRIRYERDPPDMWFADAEFAPRPLA